MTYPSLGASLTHYQTMWFLTISVLQTDATWIQEMKQIHTRFTGERGTFAQFGDSITVTMAFWASLTNPAKVPSPQMEDALRLVRVRLKPECWSKWKGPEYGSNGSMTIRWAHQNIDAWLKKLNPEVALIMFGTNDLNSVPLEEYEQKLRNVTRKCLENATVVILCTIPPRSGMLDKTRRYAETIKSVSRDLKVPLCDFFGECLRRRPDDWDGASKAFEGYKGYEVPTLISRDGVHPSNPKKFAGDYSDEGLKCNGYVLRNYVTLLSYAEVIRNVLQ